MPTTATKKVSIRPLKKTELDSMRRLWRDAGLPYKPNGRDRLRNLEKQMDGAPEYFLGAFMHGELIGVSLVTDDGRKGWINRLAVRPDHRKRGIGTMLIRESEKVLRAKGIHLLCAHIETWNEASMRLFEKHGYHVETEIAYLTKRDRDSY